MSRDETTEIKDFWAKYGESMVNSIKKTAVAAVDANGKVIFWNHAGGQVLGKNKEEVLGKSIDQAFECLGNTDRFIMWTLVTGEDVCMYKVPSQLDEDRTLLFEACPIIDAQLNKVVGAVCLSRDITEEISGERVQLEAKFVLDNIPQGVIAIDKEHRITTINKAAQRLLGLMGLPIKGKSFEEISTVLGLPRKSWYLLDTLTKGTHYQNREFAVTVMGRTVVLSLDSSRLENHYGEIVGAVGVFQDITREREMEEVIRRSEKLAALGQLAAGMAHEIRNPLTTVKGFLQLMQGKTKDKMYSEYISIISNELKQVNQIINEFLLFSQPQAPKFVVTNLFEILDETVSLIRSQASMQEVEISEKVSATLPVFKVDREQIKQVIINLSRNALESMPRGGVLTIDAFHEAGNIIIQIKDSGIGIPPQDSERIFEPFYTTKEDLGGTGLGLTVAHRIVESHGGHINVESQPHKGSTFSIILPIANDE